MIKTTVTLNEHLEKAVQEKCKELDITFREFCQNAFINELERMGDFDIRDVVESERI